MSLQIIITCLMFSIFSLFSYSTDKSPVSCGATIVNDRFFVFAAHCQALFQRYTVVTPINGITDYFILKREGLEFGEKAQSLN